MPLKVIGASFGRTGTMSLKAALEQLGFVKCYHMIDVLTLHPEHADIWLAASRGEPVDWEQLFEGYSASVDWPGCTFWKELLQQYPEAKVILSVRDPEKWYTSMQNTIYQARNTLVNRIRWQLPSQRRIGKMIDALIWKKDLQGRFKDKAYTLELYRRHIAEVQATVPAEQLLVYQISEGWGPLCEFLGVSMPQDKPFPHLNDTTNFRKMIGMQTRAIRRALYSAGATAALVLGWWFLTRNQ